MTALGQKRTLFTAPFCDCFAPETANLGLDIADDRGRVAK